MSSGVTHARWGAMYATVMTAGAYSGRIWPEAAIGAWAGLIITPDIDHSATTVEEKRWYKIARPLGVAWQAFWCPYSTAMKHGGVSHWPVIGTLTRVAYLALAASVVCALAGLPPLVWVRWVEPVTFSRFFAGWAGSDVLHAVLDATD